MLPAALTRALSRPVVSQNYRRIEGLIDADWSKPRWPEPKNLPGLLGKGKTYERRIGRALQALALSRPGSTLRCGPWIRYLDDAGRGHAQPDFLFSDRGRTWIFESKLTFWPEVFDQVLDLYLPLVEFLCGPCTPVIVFRNPGLLGSSDHRGFTLVPGSLREALGEGPGFLLHYL